MWSLKLIAKKYFQANFRIHAFRRETAKKNKITV